MQGHCFRVWIHPGTFQNFEIIHYDLFSNFVIRVKATYSATVTAPSWCTVLMSAVSGGSVANIQGETHVFEWKQNVPVPAYLIALAAGQLDSKDISDRVRIWAEPSVLADATYEFSETEVISGD